ncbi:MAG TPA: ATP-binding protein, partial [Nitrospiria bacterium]
KANYALESEINKKKKVEVRLREEGERAQKYLDLAGVIFVAIDTRQNVILLNRKGCEVLGVAENEAVGKNWFDHFIPEPERERTREAFKNLISGRIEPVEYFENRVLGRDGEKKMIAWHNTVLRGENGEIQATLSSGLDVSEKEELERRVRHAEKLAAVGKMASGFAHEIGTPLSVIGGRAEYMLRKMSKDDPLRENLGRIIGQMERIAKIVKKFLSFTRSQPIEISTVGIKPLLDDILPLFEHQILRQGIKTEMDIPASTPEIEADRDQLQQVFFNIIHNAVQVMPGGGTLSVRSREATPPQGPSAPLRRFVKIDVGDTGPGVSSENISRIFDPFFTTKEIGEGTGLGLSVGYNIVKNHGGWIQVDSDAGKGAVFSVFLPVERQG